MRFSRFSNLTVLLLLSATYHSVVGQQQQQPQLRIRAQVPAAASRGGAPPPPPPSSQVPSSPSTLAPSPPPMPPQVPPAAPIRSRNTSAPPPQLVDAWSDSSVEDYGEALDVAGSKPDNVDNDAIQGLVDRFLNKGTLEETKNEKVNTEAQRLVNSSSYWEKGAAGAPGSISDVAKARQWLKGYSDELEKVLHQVAVSGWNYFTAASSLTRDSLQEAEEVAHLFLKSTAAQARQFSLPAIPKLLPTERRQLELASKEGMNALPADSLANYNRLLADVNAVFAHTPICEQEPQQPQAPGKQTISRQIKEPSASSCLLKFSDLAFSLQSPAASTQEVLELWRGWRHTAGPNLTHYYSELVQLTNLAAELNGHPNAGAMWRSVYDSNNGAGDENSRGVTSGGGKPQARAAPTANPSSGGGGMDIQEEIERCYEQIKPFYRQLHAYMRPRLAAIYGVDAANAAGLTRDGPIPVHLLKSLNGDSFSAYYEQTKPFGEEAEEPRLSDDLQRHFHSLNYTARTMFTKVYRFLHLWGGFEPLPRSVWTESIFTRNWARDSMICQPATAYDMVAGDDGYRIKACLQLGEADWIAAHRLMTQLYYKFSARHQPILLREPTNPSLQAAVAGAFERLALNVDYLRAHRLIADGTAEQHGEPALINRLYKEALEEVTRLPFDIVADKWRYSVFEQRIQPAKAGGEKKNWASEWWDLRKRYQGITVPNEDKATASSPSAAIYDAIATPAISQQHAPATRHFVNYVAQFQVLKQLCDSGKNEGNEKTKPLSEGCMPSKEAMAVVRDTMARGGSQPWLDTFEALTGTRRLDATALLEYFEPLATWLENNNQHEGVPVGWETAASPGKPFDAKDTKLPHVRKFDEGAGFGTSHLSLPGEQQIAFPGGSCASGQECLLDSVCNGTVCVCKEGMHTLQIADTYNCVPGDPRDAGFSDGSGGLVIALTPNGGNNGTAANGGVGGGNSIPVGGISEGRSDSGLMVGGKARKGGGKGGDSLSSAVVPPPGIISGGDEMKKDGSVVQQKKPPQPPPNTTSGVGSSQAKGGAAARPTLHPVSAAATPRRMAAWGSGNLLLPAFSFAIMALLNLYLMGGN